MAYVLSFWIRYKIKLYELYENLKKEYKDKFEIRLQH